MSSVIYYQGRLADAEPMHRRALDIAHKTLGPDHPVAASSLHGLAVLAQARGECRVVDCPIKHTVTLKIGVRLGLCHVLRTVISY